MLARIVCGLRGGSGQPIIIGTRLVVQGHAKVWSIALAVAALFSSLGVFAADASKSAVVGKVVMRTATTNGIILRSYVADVILPKRTDDLVLELSARPNDDGYPIGLWHRPELTCFRLVLRDGNGKPAARTAEGERRLVTLPRDTIEWNSRGHAPLDGGKNARIQRFNLYELYVLQEGETYTLDVHTEVRRMGQSFQPLDLLNIPIKIGENPISEGEEVGKVVVKSAATDGVVLRLYLVDEALPRRTDVIALELDASSRKNDEVQFGLMHAPQRTFFRLDLRDTEGNAVKQRGGEGGDRLLSGPKPPTSTQATERMVTIGDRRIERFDLSGLFVLEEGKTYSLTVHTQVKRLGEGYRNLDLIDVPIRLGESPR